MNEILNKLNSRKYSNKTYSVVKHGNFYIIKQYVNSVENKHFDVKYTSKADVLQHLKKNIKIWPLKIID